MNGPELCPSPSRCLVLGGKGFIGSHLVDALLKGGHKVTLFDRPGTISLGTHQDKNLSFYEGNITCDADLIEALKDCDYCFHLISTVVPKSSNSDPIFDINTNLIGTVKLLNHAVRANIKKIIFLSSGGTVYGLPQQLPIEENHATNPMCSYGIIKLTIEKYLELYYKLYGLNYITLRLSNPYGERQRTQANQGAIAVFLGKALRHEQIEIWGDGNVIRDYIHVSDVINAILKSMAYTGSEHTFNIGSGYGLSLNELLHEIELVTGLWINKKYTSPRLFDVPSSVLSITRAKNVLDWSPTISFSEGLTRMTTWMIKNGPENTLAVSL